MACGLKLDGPEGRPPAAWPASATSWAARPGSPPSAPTSLLDRMRDAVSDARPAEGDAARTPTDDAYRQLLRPRGRPRPRRAPRRDQPSRSACETSPSSPTRASRTNWKPKEACKDTKAELKAVKEAQDGLEGRLRRRPRLGAARPPPRLPRRLRGGASASARSSTSRTSCCAPATS